MKQPYKGCIPLLMVGVSCFLNGCVKPEQLRLEVTEAQRERDVLRVAYEAQQLRLKELETRLSLLEDQIETNHLSTLQPVRTLPTIRLKGPQKSNTRRHTKAIARVNPRKSRKTNPSNQRSTTDRKIPTLTIDNIHLYNRGPKVSQKVRSNKAVDPPENAAYAPDLSIKNVPPLPNRFKRPTTQPVQPTSSTSLALSASRTQNTANTESDSVTKAPQSLLTQTLYSYRQKQWPVAESLHVNYLRKNPQDSYSAQIRFQLAVIYKEQGKTTHSIKQLKNFIQNHPTHAQVADALFILGTLQQQKGRKHQGLATLTRLTRLYPQSNAAKKAQKALALSHTKMLNSTHAPGN